MSSIRSDSDTLVRSPQIEISPDLVRSPPLTRRPWAEVWREIQETCQGLEPLGPTLSFHWKPTFEVAMRRAPFTEVEVVNADVLTTALSQSGQVGDAQTFRQGRKVWCLNMAHPTRPGGYVATTIGGQEEELFRRTDLHLSLTPELYKSKPLDKGRCLVTPVRVFNGPSRQGYPRLVEPQTMTIISCSAVHHRAGPEFAYQEHRDMREKIHVIFQAAIECEVDCLVLSAFGCGGFNCPPQQVATLFREALLYHYGDGAIPKVIFAIYDENWKGDSYSTFKEILR